MLFLVYMDMFWDFTSHQIPIQYARSTQIQYPDNDHISVFNTNTKKGILVIENTLRNLLLHILNNNLANREILISHLFYNFQCFFPKQTNKLIYSILLIVNN